MRGLRTWLTLAAVAAAGVAWGVQGPDRFVGEFLGDGSRLTNMQARAGIVGAAWASPWGVEAETGRLMPQGTMTPSTIWAVTSSGNLRPTATATNGVDGCWEVRGATLVPKALE